MVPYVILVAESENDFSSSPSFTDFPKNSFFSGKAQFLKEIPIFPGILELTHRNGGNFQSQR